MEGSASSFLQYQSDSHNEKILGNTERAIEEYRYFKKIRPDYMDIIWPMPIFSKTFLAGLSEAAFVASKFVTHILPRVFGGDVRAALEWQGHAPDLCEYIASMCDERNLALGRLFCRPDIIVGSDGPKVIEVNFGPSDTGLTLADTIHNYFIKTPTHGVLQEAGLSFSEAIAMLEWHKALALRLRAPHSAQLRKRFVVAVATRAEAETPKGHIRDFVDAISLLGYTASVARLHDIDATGDYALLKGEKVSIVYCMCTYAEMLAADVSARLLTDLVRLDKLRRLDFFGSPANVIYDSKANLAMAHDPAFERYFSMSELQAVRKVIAETHLVVTPGSVSSEFKTSSWVFKPINDFGGNGIVPGAEWTDEMNYADGALIVQRVVENACLWKNHVHRTNQVLCFGPSIVDGKVISILLRCASQYFPVPIINILKGAAAGVALAPINGDFA